MNKGWSNDVQPKSLGGINLMRTQATTLNRKVLLLNASFEAIRLITARHALALLWKERASLVEAAQAVVRSEREEFVVPSVVRLIHYIDIHGIKKREASRRSAIIARDRHRCQYCGVKFHPTELTLDHITPVSRKGSNTFDNLVAACRPCNNRKGDRTPEEAGMPLLRNPRTLDYMIDHQVLRHEAENRQEWHKYLFMASAV